MSNFKFDMDLLKKLVGEGLGTTMVILLGCMIKTYDGNVYKYVFGWGLSYLAAIHIFAFLCGAHLNPSVSAVATIVGAMDWKTMLCYWLIQLIGTIIGFALNMIDKNKNEVFCLTLNPVGFPELGIIGVELFGLMALLFAYCGAWDERSKEAYDSLSIRFGLIITALFFVTTFWAGGSLNFFRTVIPGLIHSSYSGLWQRFVAHVVGVGLTGIFWRFLFAEKQPEKTE